MLDLFHSLRESRRRAIFAALVATQDGGMAVGASQAFVASRFDVSRATVACIQREGLTAHWPPLHHSGRLTR